MNAVDLSAEIWTAAEIAHCLRIPSESVLSVARAVQGFPLPMRLTPEWQVNPRWQAEKIKAWISSAEKDLLQEIIDGNYLKKSTRQRFKLYRHYDIEGLLLYVGISISFFARLKKHQQDASWWDQIATIKIEHFETREACSAAEFRAIRDESPVYNINYQNYNVRSRHQ